MDRNHELVQIQGGVVVLVTERPNLCCSSIVELSNLSKLYAGIICIMILQHLTDTKKPTQKRDAAPNFQAGIVALKTKNTCTPHSESKKHIQYTRCSS